MDDSAQAPVAPHSLGRGPFAWLRRTAYQHRHDFHFLRRAEWNIIERYLEPRAGDAICDVACGDGYYSRKMAARGARVAAIDIDPHRISNALTYHAVPGIDYRLGNAEVLPFPDASFDKLVSVCALAHFGDPQGAIHEMSRVLRPGGRLVLHVESFSYRGTSLEFRKYHRARYNIENYFSAESLSTMVKAARFDVDEFCYAFGSPIAHRLFLWAERRSFTGLSFLLAFPLAYPMVRLSDRLGGQADGGYDLFVRATRRAE
jgi:ubiquinone/menaquinone biosynthesis C-methylase UbiE